MWKRIRRSLGTARRKVFPESPIDVFVVSYPKTGRTWLRSLISWYFVGCRSLRERDIFKGKVIDLKRQSGPTRIYFTHAGSEMTLGTRYQDLRIDSGLYRGKKLLLLGRDIRDTLVSAYFQATRRTGVFDGSISEFIRSEKYGVHKVVAFYQSWVDEAGRPDRLLLVLYEDLHSDPSATLEKVLTFLEVTEIDPTILHASVKRSSFKSMQRAETTGRYDHSRIRPADERDSESYKVRKGEVGGYGEYLSTDDLAYIDSVLAESDFSFSKLRSRC